MRQFRIFVASPGDVTEERGLAGEVIEQLRHERRFRDELNLQKIAWDQPGQAIALPMGMTPQQAISKGLMQPCECDLVLVLLWSRMGTPLPAEYVKPDGTPYLSGTEWEYWNAMQAFRAHGKPSIWMYRRTAPPPAKLDDPDFPEKREQWTRLQSFLGMIRNPDGSIAHGVNHYDDPASFRQQFEAHMRDELERVLRTAQSQASSPTINRAARLEPKAQPGGVLIDTDTYATLPPDLKTLYRGPQTIAGKRDETFDAYAWQANAQGPGDAEHFVRLGSGKSASAAIIPPAVSSAVKLWEEKLAYLLQEEAKAIDPSAKFKIRQDIEEARQRIADLLGRQ